MEILDFLLQSCLKLLFKILILINMINGTLKERIDRKLTLKLFVIKVLSQLIILISSL